MTVLIALASAVASLAVTPSTRVLIDPARGRNIPIAIYATPGQARQPLAIISHGYGGRNTDYSFIASALAARGYYVVSIQHELPGDEPLPRTGNPYETRMPSWRRGVENILFVIAELKKTQPGLDYHRLLLVGHSHGGDTSMLFAREHPELTHAVVSLDNRRMPIPRTSQPCILTIRSSDQPADPGVLPSDDERRRFAIQVVTLGATIHDDMWDGATDAQKTEILRHIEAFLRGGAGR
jgi:predicted dienelactone hydrolase